MADINLLQIAFRMCSDPFTFFHILSRCSLMLKQFKFIFSFISAHLIPRNDKAKTENYQFSKVYQKGKTEISHWQNYSDTLLWHLKFSSGASHFSWSSLRYFQLWLIQLMDMIWKRYIPVNIRSHSWQCLSEQKPRHEVEGTPCRTQRLGCVEEQIWGRLQKNLLHRKFPEQWHCLVLNGTSFNNRNSSRAGVQPIWAIKESLGM